MAMIILKWWRCVKPNKRGRVLALLGPHQHALAIYDNHTVKKTARTMQKSKFTHTTSETLVYICSGCSHLRVR